jgi:hypothetical protein
MSASGFGNVITSQRTPQPYCARIVHEPGAHPLHELLVAAAAGSFPPADGGVSVVAPLPGDHHAVVEFTGHSVVVTDRSADEVLARGADGFGGSSHPDLLRWLAGAAGWIGSHDVVLVAEGTGRSSLPERTDLENHPRVRRARDHRHAVRVFGDDDGLVTIGRGLVGRIEMSIEAGTVGGGQGRRLVEAGRGVVPSGTLVWAQVAPGNAASLRAFLAGGFEPVGAETLIRP